MVHLSQIPTDAVRDEPLVEGMKSISLDTPSNTDTFTTTVYGSRFAAQDLPKHEMPEGEMPKEVAYRMIKDDLSLDGNPMLNLASFVTTYMVSLLLFVQGAEASWWRGCAVGGPSPYSRHQLQQIRQP